MYKNTRRKIQEQLLKNRILLVLTIGLILVSCQQHQKDTEAIELLKLDLINSWKNAKLDSSEIESLMNVNIETIDILAISKEYSQPLFGTDSLFLVKSRDTKSNEELWVYLCSILKKYADFKLVERKSRLSALVSNNLIVSPYHYEYDSENFIRVGILLDYPSSHLQKPYLELDTLINGKRRFEFQDGDFRIPLDYFKGELTGRVYIYDDFDEKRRMYPFAIPIE